MGLSIVHESIFCLIRKDGRFLTETWLDLETPILELLFLSFSHKVLWTSYFA